VPVEVGLEMYGEREVVLPFFTGYVARGLLLHFVGQVDASASGLLHELNVAVRWRGCGLPPAGAK